MSDAKERQKAAKARHTARMEAEGRQRLTLQVPDEHVAAHREAAAGRPQELERLREHVEGAVREHVLHWLDRWNRMALRRAARAERRRHPAGSNAPPARIRFGSIPPEGFRKRLREAGWWYDWIAAVWNLPEDSGRWPAADALVAEAEVSGIPLERLAPGPGIEGLDTPAAPPPSLWRKRSGPTGRGRDSFKVRMRGNQRRQLYDLKGLTPKEARDWKPENDLRSLHVWARAEDAEAHQLAAWQPHALARLRDRLVAELAPEVRAKVAARMSRQVEDARQMQAGAGSPADVAGDARKAAVIPDWILQGRGGAPRPWPRRSRRGLIRPGAFFPAQLLAALRPSAARALAVLRA